MLILWGGYLLAIFLEVMARNASGFQENCEEVLSLVLEEHIILLLELH